jgi:TRAP transporter TAXI family solute receptor
MKAMKLISLLLLALILIVGCSQESNTPAEGSSQSDQKQENETSKEDTPSNKEDSSNVEWPELLVFATPSQGSSGHVAATIIADMLKKETPIRQVVVEPYGNSSNMIRPLDEGKADFAFYGSYREFTDAYYGVGSWAKEGPKNLKSLMFMYVDPWGVMVTDPAIKDFGDLKGKKFVLFANNTDHVNVFNALLEIYNMTEKDLTVIPAQDVGSATRWLAEGKADAFMFGAAPAMQEVKQAKGLYGLEMPPEVVEQIRAKEPTRLAFTIPAGKTVLAPEQDLPYLGLPGGVGVRGDLDENLVYEITKLIYEKAGDQLFKAKPTSPMNWKPEHATEIFTYPLHDGMIRYLEEENLWTDELKNEQQELSKK